MGRTLIISALLLLGAGGGARAADGPYYFIPVYNSGESEGTLEESYNVLLRMVSLAAERNYKLTLMFTPKYADYLSTSPVRMAELRNWKNAGHEIGAWHRGPAEAGWDGYTDLSGDALARARGTAKPPAAPVGGHKEYFAALQRLEFDIKTGCMQDKTDKEFLAAAPGYEVCPGKSAGGKKARLSAASPSGRVEIEASTRTFSRMNYGVYGAAFDSTPADFGSFYAWLRFLRDRDPAGLKSRTVSGIAENKLLPEKKEGTTLKVGKPPAKTVKQPADPPRLRPVAGVRQSIPGARTGGQPLQTGRLKPTRGFYSRFINFITVPAGRKVIIIQARPKNIPQTIPAKTSPLPPKK